MTTPAIPAIPAENLMNPRSPSFLDPFRAIYKPDVDWLLEEVVLGRTLGDLDTSGWLGTRF